MIDNNLKQRIIESIESNIKVLQNGINDLGEKQPKSREKLGLEYKEMLLDLATHLEIAIYRARLYNIRISKNEIVAKVSALNTDLNTIVAENYSCEFLHILNFKIASLLTFIIDHIA